MGDVSILLPTLHLNDYFFLTFESILKIDYPSLEIIIVHDQQVSHQDDLKGFDYLAKNAGHKLVFTHSLEPGLVAALNQGISLSTKEFICRIDSDDLILPNRVQLQVDFLRKNPKVAVVGGQLKYMDSLGRVKDKVSNYPIDPESTRVKFEKGCFLAHPASMFRTAEIRSLGGYRKFFKSAEDLDLWLRVLEFRDISNLEEEVIIYREHSGQMSSKLSDVDLYTRIAYRSSELRKSNRSEDLPTSLVNIERWLSTSHATAFFPRVIGQPLANRYSSITSMVLLKLKLSRFQKKYHSFTLLLLLASIIMPLRLTREAFSFFKFRVQRTSK